jgi:hypothetical protein
MDANDDAVCRAHVNLLEIPRFVAAIVLLVVVSACRPTISVDSVTVFEDDYNRSIEQILNLAERDFPCPRDQLVTTLMEVTVQGEVQLVHVDGCDLRGDYERTSDGFVRQ